MLLIRIRRGRRDVRRWLSQGGDQEVARSPQPTRGSSFAKTHGCSARGFILCSFLLLASLAPVHGQDPKANELRYEELPNFGMVNEKLYRGGQPRKGGVRRLVALGVNTIINLRDETKAL